MAKTRAPLFSFEARGKLADSLVFFPWKGVNAIRTYVIPANPKTPAQTTQRNRLEAAVDAWHATNTTADDRTAWNRLASLAATARSGFNRMVEEHIKNAILGKTWWKIRNGRFTGITTTQFFFWVDSDAGAPNCKCYVGTTKTHFPYSDTMPMVDGGQFRAQVPGLTADTLYYVYATRGEGSAQVGRTGIYQVRTAAA